MIHLKKHTFSGLYYSEVDDKPPGWRIDTGTYPDARLAVLGALNTITTWCLQSVNYNTFEEWCQIAGAIGPDFADVLFSTNPQNTKENKP